MGLGAWPIPVGVPREGAALGLGQAGQALPAALLTLSGGSVCPGLWQHIDHYSRTKAIADQLTLMANGTPLPGEYHGALLISNAPAHCCLVQNTCVIHANV